MARRRITSALAFYGALTAGAIGVLLLGDRPLAAHPDPWLEASRWLRILISIGLGVVVLGLGIVSTRYVVKTRHWARELHIGFRELLGPLSAGEIAVFAITSGVAEELFFRGALQPWLGYALASFVFGVVHIGPGRRFLPWTLWAIVMGFVLGAVYEFTGEILGPIIAHVFINYENLHFLNSHDPREEQTSPVDTTSLVGARERGGASRSWH